MADPADSKIVLHTQRCRDGKGPCDCEWLATPAGRALEPQAGRQDTRRTSAEKLEALRELTGRMRAAAASGETPAADFDARRAAGDRIPSLSIWAQRIDTILDGEF